MVWRKYWLVLESGWITHYLNIERETTKVRNLFELHHMLVKDAKRETTKVRNLFELHHMLVKDETMH
ncbi:hypothetical protein YC2023_048000 [Brassica napus]